MKGYWSRPDITDEVLRGGWMHSGDLGAFDQEGFLYILDRRGHDQNGIENVFSPVFADACQKDGTGKVQKTLLRERFGSVSTKQ